MLRSEAFLTLHRPGEAPRRLPLPGVCYRIGRDPDSDIRIDHPSVSRRHALL
jgi:peptidoglycan glycosyltransferase